MKRERQITDFFAFKSKRLKGLLFFLSSWGIQKCFYWLINNDNVSSKRPKPKVEGREDSLTESFNCHTHNQCNLYGKCLQIQHTVKFEKKEIHVFCHFLELKFLVGTVLFYLCLVTHVFLISQRSMFFQDKVNCPFSLCISFSCVPKLYGLGVGKGVLKSNLSRSRAAQKTSLTPPQFCICSKSGLSGL